MKTVERDPETTKSASHRIAGFNHSEFFARKAFPSGQKTQEKNAGAEEITMIGVQLPVTALAKAMAISGLMWAAIVYQAVLWLG